MRAEPLIWRSSYGRHKDACAIARKAFREVEAYRQFLQARGIAKSGQLPFSSLPVMDKRNYFSRWPYFSLVPSTNWPDVYFVFRSSGSSGKPFSWPQLKGSYRSFDRQLENILCHAFAIDRHATLVIVGLALGSWIGGDLVSWALKNIALRSKYPMTVFSCGNQHPEIIEIIAKARDLPKQVLIFVCPSAIGHLFLTARQMKVKLPFARMRFAVLGEPFTEKMRMDVDNTCGLKFPWVSMISAYGSADTGVIGMESLSSIALRRLLLFSEESRKALGIAGAPPNLYHISAKGVFIETVGGELVFTRWQGMPLVRYNLHDHCAIMSWQEARKAIARIKVERKLEPLRSAVVKARLLPDLLAVYGRSDRTLFLCGTNITEAMIMASMEDGRLLKYTTGIFNVMVDEEDGRQYLLWHIELCQGIKPSFKIEDILYAVLVKRLGHLQPEFESDYQNIYKKWDSSRAKRIFRFKLYLWQTFPRKDGQIKHSVIRETKV